MPKKQITKLLRIIMIPIAIASTWYFTGEFVRVWITPLPDTIQEEMNNAIDHGFDGMIVYVDEAGKAPAFYAAGWKDRKNKVPADPQSIFKIASISKLYVALAVTKLVKDERLSLDKTLADYFPEFANRIEHADQITLRQMVQHRSGIPNITDYPNYWENPPETSLEKLELIFDLPAKFEPDEDYEYSNTNYLLIRELIKKTVGFSHLQYIKEEILIPYGFNNTFGSLDEVNIDDVMGGYYVGVEPDIKTNNYGSMLATAEDVGRFLRALNNGSLFEEGEQEIYSSIYVYEHTGLIPGYQSIAKYHKDIDAVVIQFINTTNFKGHTWFISEIVYDRILKILRNDRDL